MINRFSIVAVFLLCVTGFFVTKHIQDSSILTKRITYTNDSASQVVMVWGVNYLFLPEKKYWPAGSVEKKQLVYTTLQRTGSTFSIDLSLPNETLLNYWMVEVKDRGGHGVEIWDSSGNEQEYFTVKFQNDQLLKPGYFIFLAGFLPLLMIYQLNKRKAVYIHPPLYKISNYVPQFDTIRAIAVLLVIVHHWFEHNKVLNFFPNGALGVNMFFTLSGFLITGILLKARDQVDHGSSSTSSALKTFYIRRTLRIFPIYYLLLIIFWLLKDPAVHQHPWYYFTYTSNFLFYFNEIFPARVAHLWSLAVEEQFYLVWPWLILLTKRKWLPYVIGLFLVIGISSNYIFTEHGWWVRIFTPACFDAFAIGGGLSYLVSYRHDIIQRLQSMWKYILLASIVMFMLEIYSYGILPAKTIHALLAACIIYYCLFKNNNRLANAVLNNGWLMWLGKISYGVYLYHLFVPELYEWILKELQVRGYDFLYNRLMPSSIEPVWLFIQEFSFLLLLCVLSWRLIENPVNGLKRLFEYKEITPVVVTIVSDETKH